MNATPPITEAELHAFIDGQLPTERVAQIHAYLQTRPDEIQRLEDFRAQKHALHRMFDPVLSEPVPPRLQRTAAQPPTPWYQQRLAAGILIACVSGAAGWGLHGVTRPSSGLLAQSKPGINATAPSGPAARGFVQRAAVAHAVYSVDQRRAVELDAAHEDQLITWLSKRMARPMKAPHLQALGYSLEGGRLLPGAKSPVAQFMYRRANSETTQGRLTLYVSSEIGDLGNSTPLPSLAREGQNTAAAFSFAQQGDLKLFYWVDGPWGYAISAETDTKDLTRVSSEVYRQLASGTASPTR